MANDDPVEWAPGFLDQESSSPSHFYVNGFSVGHTNADSLVRFQLNGKPEVDIQMSFTLAKTLVGLLGKLISNLEQQVNMDIKTTKDIDAAMQRGSSQDERP